MSINLIRDPIHDFISFEESSKIDNLLIELINLPEFQRLRRIWQLGLSCYVYPGGTHTRFSHSLGVIHITKKMVNQLKKRYPEDINEEDENAVILAALLHDIGHGPFSHLSENIFSENTEKHEKWSLKIIDQTRIAEYLGTIGDRVKEFIQAKPDTDFLGHIISSQLDADRFDYLLRDNIMTGAQYGQFDLNWIIQCLECNKSENRLEIREKGILALEGYLQARYHMYRNVYYHKTVKAAEIVFRKIFRRLRKMANSDPEIKKYAIWAKISTNEELSVNEYLSLDDSEVWTVFKNWSENSKDDILSDLTKCLLERNIFKVIFVTDPEDEENRDINIEKWHKNLSIMEEHFGKITEGEYYWDKETKADQPYRPYSPDDAEPKTSIYVRKNGESIEVSKLSNIIRALTKHYRLYRIFVHPKYEDEIIKKMEG